MRSLGLFPQMAGARYSACQTYRYDLWRKWDEALSLLTVIMLNPSAATEWENDPTVERCQRRAAAWGYGGLRVLNLFALRSTDPQRLHSVADPTGPDNDQAILTAISDVASVVIAWGTHGEHLARAEHVLQLLRTANVRALCLGENGDGSPKHPLYVAYGIPLRPYATEPAKGASNANVLT